MKALYRAYDRLTPVFTYGQSLFLLIVRLYFGSQLAHNGWAKLHNLGQVTEYFASINVPMAHTTAVMVSLLELVSGVLLVLGLGARLISVPLTINLFAAYWFGDHEAFLSFFSDPDKFTGAAPFNFLFTSLLILLFGPGLFSIDALIRKFTKPRKADVHVMAA
jgi:putative oxidoreductase